MALLMSCQPEINTRMQIDCSALKSNLLAGEITQGMSLCNWDLNDTLFLFSGGGDLETAIQVSNSIKLAGTKTQVIKRCDQECILLLSSGSHRSMCNNTILGLNQFKSPSDLERILQFYDDDPRIDGELMREILTENYEVQMYMLPHLALIVGLIDYVIPCEPSIDE